MAITLHSQPDLIALAGNELEYDFSTNQYAQDFIGIHCQLEVYNGSTYDDVGNEKRLTLDDSHHAIFDPSSLLSWEPEKKFTWPELSNNYLVKRNDLRKQYRVTRSEKYGNPLAEYNSASTTALYALPGGISKIQKGILNEASESWYDKIVAEKIFLTNAPAIKIIDPLSIERLYYMVIDNITSIYLKVYIQYTDGTSETRTLDNDTCAQYDVWECILSPAAIGVDYFSESKTVKQYSVFLTENSGDAITAAVSEVKTFKIDRVPRPGARYFLFNNSYKMTEGIRFAGSWYSEAEYGMDFMNKVGSMDDVTTDALIEKMNTTEIQKFSCNSGWISKDQLILYREFFLSKRVYWVINEMTIPIIVTSKNITTSRDDNHLYNIEMEFSLAHTDQFANVDFPDFELDETDYLIGTEELVDWANSGLDYFTVDGNRIDEATEDTEDGGYVISDTEISGASNKLYATIINLLITDPAYNVYFYLHDSTAGQSFWGPVSLISGQNIVIFRCPAAVLSSYYVRIGVPAGETTDFYTTDDVTVKQPTAALIRKLYREANH